MNTICKIKRFQDFKNRIFHAKYTFALGSLCKTKKNSHYNNTFQTFNGTKSYFCFVTQKGRCFEVKDFVPKKEKKVKTDFPTKNNFY